MPLPFSVQQPATAAPLQSQYTQHHTSAATRPEPESPRAMYPFPRINSNQSGSRSTINVSGAAEASQSMVHRRNNLSTVSLASRYSLSANKATALEVYNLVYGNVPGVTPIETVERLYEVNAGAYLAFILRTTKPALKLIASSKSGTRSVLYYTIAQCTCVSRHPWLDREACQANGWACQILADFRIVEQVREPAGDCLVASGHCRHQRADAAARTAGRASSARHVQDTLPAALHGRSSRTVVSGTTCMERHRRHL